MTVATYPTFDKNFDSDVSDCKWRSAKVPCPHFDSMGEGCNSSRSIWTFLNGGCNLEKAKDLPLLWVKISVKVGNSNPIRKYRNSRFSEKSTHCTSHHTSWVLTICYCQTLGSIFFWNSFTVLITQPTRNAMFEKRTLMSLLKTK